MVLWRAARGGVGFRSVHKAHDDSTSDDRANDAGRNAANAAEGNGGATGDVNDSTSADSTRGTDGIRAEKSATAPLADKPRDDHGLMVQMTRFIISGVIAAVVDFGLTFVMLNVFGASDFWGKSVGWVFGTITAYLINRRWTFQAAPSTRRFLMVAALYTITYFVNVGLHAVLYRLFSGWEWNDSLAIVVAFVIAQGTATVINFIVQRVFIFR